MQSKSNFITIFVLLFLQTWSQLKAATTQRSSDVLWLTQELQTTRNGVQQDFTQVDPAVKNLSDKLNHILNEMQSLIDLMLSDDANVDNDSGYQQDPAEAKRLELRRQASQHYLDIYRHILWNATTAAHPNQPNPPPLPESYNKGQSKSDQVDPVNNLVEKVQERHTLPIFLFRPQMISVYPICGSNDSMEDNRAPSNSIDLSFDLDFTKPSRDVIINVTSAVLKMYKRSIREELDQKLGPPRARVMHFTRGGPSFWSSSREHSNNDLVQLPPNKNVTFTAIYFKNPHHNKKDSNRKGIKLGEQTFRVGEERWTEWDIKKAISAWYNNTSRNNGVTIKVADDQIRLPAREFFNIPINCSLITDWPALPPEMMRKSSFDGISVQIPFLDLTIQEVPKTEAKFTEKEQELVSEAKLLKQQMNAGHDTTNSSAEHKIRHHKKNKETK